ncbi:MAG: tetratricopeptide repeat protein [Deltaproteobacteria bacterium]|nr:tetratricopeptide repeat protein [Deltaproteobacteria bacterium]
MKSLTVARLSLLLAWPSRYLLISTCSALAVGAWEPRVALAQSEEAVSKVKDLNQKALTAYDNLELEEARKALTEALQICAQEGMNEHPWKARTHVHLGAILVGGFQQKELAVKQFQRALEIQPEIQLTPSLRNPETQAVFDEAKKGGGSKPVATKPTEAPAEKPPEPAKEEPAGITHQPVATSPVGAKVEIKAKVSKVKFSRLVLAYRPEGATGFLARDMEATGEGWYVARIPEPATQGGLVQYYIEARDDMGRAVANNGSETEPHVVALGDAAAGVDAASLVEAEPEAAPAADETPAGPDKVGFVFGVSVGSGFGYVSGSPEVNPTVADDDGDPNTPAADINFSGVAASKLGHLNIEAGYAIRPGFILSLQARMQKVSGATEAFSVVDSNGTTKKFSPATGAVSVFGKATWLLGAPGSIRPFVSVMGGGGELRHVVDIGDKRADCGPLPMPEVGIDPNDSATLPNQKCVDTVKSGPLLVGGSAGLILKLADSVGVTAGLNGIVGIPNFALHADLNLGMLLLL